MAALAVLILPLYLSDRYTDDAWHAWQNRRQVEYDRFDRAADLNPLSVKPLVYKAVVAEEAGEAPTALAALHSAQGRRPDEWTLYYLEARVLAKSDPRRADAALATARSLNPRGSEIDQLERKIRG